jgi:hypothetical protein
MKINNLTIKGFRGFNDERTIVFHPKLTTIYGRNSYGKTSITEAVEWLFYGKTSKVEKGESKDEYKGSYRNCHLENDDSVYVNISLNIDDQQTTYSAKLIDKDNYCRYINGEIVDQWPIDSESASISRPFIMQHALKYLLLTPRDSRFTGFTKLLGFDELDIIQADFISVCTKIKSTLPTQVTKYISNINNIENRLAACSDLKNIYKLFKKGEGSFSDFVICVNTECTSRIPVDTPEDKIIPSLLRIRDDAVKKIYSGSINLTPFSANDNTNNSADLEYFPNYASEELIQSYCGLLALETYKVISDEAEFYQIGLSFLANNPYICPFCNQKTNDSINEHIKKKHQESITKSENARVLLKQKQEILTSLSELTQRLDKCQNRHISKLNAFLKINDSFEKLNEILSPMHEPYLIAIRDAIKQLTAIKNQLDQCFNNITKSIISLQNSIQQSKEEITIIQILGKELIKYSGVLSSSISTISHFISPMADANEILKHELDSIAKTEDISLLVDLKENLSHIKKGMRINSILDKLPELRKTVEQYIGLKMFNAVTKEMTDDVMSWYKQIRTKGDPDVHFTGFDMDKTKSGDIKPKHIKINASSYGKQLVSAVSSLSESKLNALGLCLSIATNMKPDCPFDFLFIDDPIQSLDDAHGERFIDIIRDLVDRGKQIILLSHNKTWIDSVRKGCRSINGFCYEITGYDKNGPIIIQEDWCTWKQRLDRISAIANNTNSSSLSLQDAESEIRLAISEMTCTLYLKIKNIRKDSNSMNYSKVVKCLTECNIPNVLTDCIGQSFNTIDDSHHNPNYNPDPDRIKCYLNYLYELSKYLNVQI